MPTNGITVPAPPPAPTTARRRRRFYTSGLAVRVVIALVISWLIVMAFFVTSVASH